MNSNRKLGARQANGLAWTTCHRNSHVSYRSLRVWIHSTVHIDGEIFKLGSKTSLQWTCASLLTTWFLIYVVWLKGWTEFKPPRCFFLRWATSKRGRDVDQTRWLLQQDCWRTPCLEPRRIHLLRSTTLKRRGRRVLFDPHADVNREL